MKFIALVIFSCILLSLGLSQPVNKNLKESTNSDVVLFPGHSNEEAKKYLKVLMNLYLESLTKGLNRIEQNLRKNKKLDEAERVNKALNLLEKQKINEYSETAIDFVFENLKYCYKEGDLKNQNSNVYKEMFVLHKTVLERCEKELRANGKEDEAKKANSLKTKIENKLIPAYEEIYYLVMHYEKHFLFFY